MTKQKKIIGKCSYCGGFIFFNEKFKELNTPLRDIEGKYASWIVHKKCLFSAITLIFKSIKTELESYERLIFNLMGKKGR